MSNTNAEESAPVLKSKDSVKSIREDMRIQKISLTKFINAALAKQAEELTCEYVSLVVKQGLDKLKTLKSSQKDLYLMLTNVELNEETLQAELDKQMDSDIEYNDKINVNVAKLQASLSNVKKAEREASENNEGSRESAPVPLRLKPPELKIGTFSDNANDPFNFFRFKSSFHNALDSFNDTTDAVKLVYLKSYLRGRALAVVENLPIADGNLEVAWAMLEEEFMDVDLLINSSLSGIITWRECNSLDETMKFISHLKIKLFELQKIGLNFFDKDSAGEILISNIVRAKLYNPFLKELCRKLGNNYPTVKDLLEHYISISKLMNPRDVKDVKPKGRGIVEGQEVFKSSGSNYFPSSPKMKGCKFCSMLNHSSLHCKKYANYEDRLRRARELKLCIRCLSAKHFEKDCPGKLGQLPYQCQSCFTATHVTPLCSSMVLSLSSAKNLTSNGDKK